MPSWNVTLDVTLDQEADTDTLTDLFERLDNLGALLNIGDDDLSRLIVNLTVETEIVDSLLATGLAKTIFETALSEHGLSIKEIVFSEGIRPEAAAIRDRNMARLLLAHQMPDHTLN